MCDLELGSIGTYGLDRYRSQGGEVRGSRGLGREVMASQEAGERSLGHEMAEAVMVA